MASHDNFSTRSHATQQTQQTGRTNNNEFSSSFNRFAPQSAVFVPDAGPREKYASSQRPLPQTPSYTPSRLHTPEPRRSLDTSMDSPSSVTSAMTARTSQSQGHRDQSAMHMQVIAIYYYYIIIPFVSFTAVQRAYSGEGRPQDLALTVGGASASQRSGSAAPAAGGSVDGRQGMRVRSPHPYIPSSGAAVTLSQKQYQQTQHQQNQYQHTQAINQVHIICTINKQIAHAIHSSISFFIFAAESPVFFLHLSRRSCACAEPAMVSPHRRCTSLHSACKRSGWIAAAPASRGPSHALAVALVVVAIFGARVATKILKWSEGTGGRLTG